MDDMESKKLLENTLALVEENNQMLRGIRRSQRIASFMSLLYWLVIIGVTFGGLYLLQPYIDKMVNLYNSISNTEQKLNTSGVKFFKGIN